MYAQFYDQIGAYSLVLKNLTGIKAKGGVVVCARRSGAPTVKMMSELDLLAAEQRYLERLNIYLARLDLAA